MFFSIKKKITKKWLEFRQTKKHLRFYEGKVPAVYLNLKHRTKVRTYLNLIFAIKTKYDTPIVIKFSIIRMFLLSKWFQELDYIFFENPFSKTTKITTFGHSKSDNFRINYGYKNVYESDKFVPNVLPYCMHPANYLCSSPSLLPKTIGVILSGNFQENIYNTDFIPSYFKIQNRWQIFQKLQNYQHLVQVTGDSLVANISSDIYKNKMVQMQWQLGAIATEKWRYYLSAADFIFCAPGMTMPLCHNVIEALSVGVIPILNYPNWLNPSLQDGVNCLVYNGKNLFEVIDKALEMNALEKKKLSENASLLYDMYYKNFVFDVNNKDLIILNENKNDLK